MNKTKFLLGITFLLLTSTTFSQTNKPEAGAFGIRAGVSIPNVGIGLTFSRMLKKNIECGSSIGFTISSSKHNQTSSGIMVYSTNGFIDVSQDYNYRFLNYTATLAPFLVYHIPTNINLDVFAGGRLLFALSEQTNYTHVNRLYANNYESKSSSHIDFPFSFGVGAGVLIGADYYFRRNMAVGMSGNLGFSSSFQHGTQAEKTTTTNSGSLNPSQGVTNSEQKWNKRNFYTNTGLNGSVGINFTIFFARKVSDKS